MRVVRPVLAGVLAVVLASCGGNGDSVAPTFAVLPATAFPTPGSKSAPLDVQPSVTLSQSATLASVAGALHLSAGGKAVEGAVVLDGPATLAFVPTAPLPTSTEFTVTLDASVADAYGTRLGVPFHWTFTTEAAAPTPLPPAIVYVSPVDGALDVPLNAGITVIFSQAMDSSVTGAVHLTKLTGEEVLSSTHLEADGRTLHLFPSALGLGQGYAVLVSAEAKSSQGVPLAAARRWTFRTISDPDALAQLKVVSVTPADGTTDVAASTTITALLSLPLSDASAAALAAPDETLFTIAPAAGGAVLGASAGYDAEARQIVLTPASPLSPSTPYVATLTGLTSASGKPLTPSSVSVHFTTAADPLFGQRPTVVSVNPPAGTQNVGPHQVFVFTFSRTMDFSTFYGATVRIGGHVVGVSRGPDQPSTQLVLTPSAPWPADVDLTIDLPDTLLAQASDRAALVPYSATFHTRADHVPPTVIGTDPQDGDSCVSTASALTFLVSEELAVPPNPLVTLAGPNGPIVGTTAYDPVEEAVIFTPDEYLPAQSDFTATLTNVQDLAGNPAQPYDLGFHTCGTPDVTPPAFNGLQSATAIDETHAHLTWVAATDAGSRHLTYLVWATPGTTVDFTSAPALETARDVTSVDLANLASGMPYAFAVRAKDAWGNVDANTVTRAFVMPDLHPPVFLGLSSFVPASGQAALVASWAAATDNAVGPGQITYRVYVADHAGGEVYDASGLAFQTAPGATSATITAGAGGTPLVQGKAYFAVVHAVDPAGNESTDNVERSAVVPDVTAPVFTSPVTLAPVNSTSVQVSWKAAVDNVDSATVLTYRVSKRRTTDTTFDPPESTFGSGLTFVVGGLDSQTSYVFRVEARDRAGNVAVNPNQPQGMTLDVSPPRFPNGPGLNASATGGGSVGLTWNPAQDDRDAASAITYLVYASTSAGTLYGGTPAITVTGTTQASVSGLSAGTWFFGVRAKDTAGNVDANTASVSVDVN